MIGWDPKDKFEEKVHAINPQAKEAEVEDLIVSL